MYWQRKQSLCYFSTGHPLIASRQTQSLTLYTSDIHVLILQLFNHQSCYTHYLLCATSRVIFNIICVNYKRNAIRAVGLFVEFARGEKNILIIIITSSWQERFLPPRLRIELVNVINMPWWCGKTIQPSHMYTHVHVYSIWTKGLPSVNYFIDSYSVLHVYTYST